MNFEDALLASVRKLDRVKKSGFIDNFIVIGAIALSRLGKVRSTGDIDFAIKLSEKSLAALAKELGGEARFGDLDDPLVGCLNFAVGSGPSRVNIQLIQFPKGIEDAAFLDYEKQKVKGVQVPFASWIGLLMLKLYAGSPLDLQDAQSIVDNKKCTHIEFQRVQALASKLRLSGRITKISR